MPRHAFIEIIGARTHNLKNVSARVPLGRLTVITGPSGSGKSSLAFDTLYAEGQRRFVESMSAYARQFIEKMARPDVDQIRNIQPAIAVEQKNSVKNARSTIGTATEISDYLRLLLARAGVTICPDCSLEVREDSPSLVTQDLLGRFAGRRFYIVAPIDRNPKVRSEALKAELLRAGFSRLFVGGAKPGEISKKKKLAPKPGGSSPVLNLDEASAQEAADALKAPLVRVIIDRVVADVTDRDRISTSIATAFLAGKGTVEILPAETTDTELARLVYHAGFRCNGCGKAFPKPEPNLFSFNSPLGACPECSGFGRVAGPDWDKVIPDRSRSLEQRPIAPFNTPSYRKNYSWMKKMMAAAGVPWDVPLNEFTADQWNAFLYGRSKKIEGLKAFFDWLETEKYKVQSRILMARYRCFTKCPVCNGMRLVPAALNVKWAPASGKLPQRTIGELTRLSIRDMLGEFVAVELNKHEDELYGRIFREILARLTYLARVGLGYLTLDRQTRTLSGGEAQRINLATALGTALTQTLYVLDEPTVGLHPRDSLRLLEILRDLRDKGNTIVVVEHDPELILGADEIIDIGPRAGSLGGEIIFAGTPEKLLSNGTESLTAKFLKKWDGHSCPSFSGTKETGRNARPTINKVPHISIIGAREHNLKNISVEIPLNKWVCITGVSGSGKTTLVYNILYQGFNRYKRRATEDVGEFKEVRGLDALDEILLIDQSPIGRSIRSNPVTYVKAYDPIRKLLASTREARALGLTESSFSFNVKGGRCETCEGTGVTTYDMHFLAEITLPCEACCGRRFQPRVLQVHYKGRNADQILGMTIDDAADFFSDQKAILRKLAPLRDVGLGYLTLGQNTSTLSGGEAQRLKLASYLSTGGDGKRTMMVFDEPTTGLHLADLAVLSGVFRRLIQSGYSLVVIEHNIEIIRQADWIIDLGPKGGAEGGYVIATGSPAAIAAAARSHTGRFLQ